MDVTLLLLLGMVVPANGFPVLYAGFYRWWEKPLGRALMTKACGLALILDISIAYNLLGDYPGREQVRVAAFTLVLIGLWYQFLVFLRIRMEDSDTPNGVEVSDT